MQQITRNLTDPGAGTVRHNLYILHDCDSQFCTSFRSTLSQPSSPHLNAFAERWVRSAKDECLSKLVLFGEASLRRALNEYTEHHHAERNHQGKGNLLLFPRAPSRPPMSGEVVCKQRLGGLLKYYSRAA
jgi:putative transposase